MLDFPPGRAQILTEGELTLSHAVDILYAELWKHPFNLPDIEMIARCTGVVLCVKAVRFM